MAHTTSLPSCSSLLLSLWHACQLRWPFQSQFSMQRQRQARILWKEEEMTSDMTPMSMIQKRQLLFPLRSEGNNEPASISYQSLSLVSHNSQILLYLGWVFLFISPPWKTKKVKWCWNVRIFSGLLLQTYSAAYVESGYLEKWGKRI